MEQVGDSHSKSKERQEAVNAAYVEQLKQKLAEAKQRQYADAIRFMIDNPHVPFERVGTKYGFSGMQASRLWRRVGFPPRRPARKPGVSPLKKEKN